MNDSSRKMIRSAASFFSGTLLSRVTGLLRDIAMAFAFGTEASLASFFVAFRFAHLLRRLLGESSLQTAFIPQFEELRFKEKSKTRAMQFFLNLYFALSLVLLFVVAAGTFFGYGLLIYFGKRWGEGSLEILTLSMFMLPSLLFICLAGLNTALLQCERCYFLPAAAPVAFNLLWITGVLTLAAVPAQEAMPKLAIWIIVACFFQWGVMLPKVFLLLRQNGLTFKSLLRVNPFSNDLCSMWKPFLLGIVGVGASQINSACDALFARYAEESGPAYLWYAVRLQQLPLALFGIALSNALLPPMTQAIKEGNQKGFLSLFEVATHRCLLLMIPITLGIYILGERSLDLVYGYGDFGAESVLKTTQCLWAYTAGLIPMALVLITAPVYYAQSDYRTPTIASLVAMVLNMALNTIFVLKLSLSASSIALATSVSAWINLSLLIIPMHLSAQSAFFNGIRQCLKDTGKALLLTSAVVWPASFAMPAGDSFVSKCSCFVILAFLFLAFFAGSYAFFSKGKSEKMLKRSR